MANLKRLVLILVLVVFAVSVSGCMGGGSKSGGDSVVINPEDPGDNNGGSGDNNGEEPVDTDEVDYVLYNPNGNKAPKVTNFNTDDLDEAVVAQGQQVTFDATGIDPDGTAVTIKYEATGGNFNGNVWTAPNESGYYQVIAYAVDTNGLKSDPAIITIRVEKPEGAGNVRLSAIPKVKLGTATAKRPITIDEGDTFGDTYSLILSTRTQDDNHTATIEITFTDTNANHNFTYAADKGMVTPISEEDLGGNEYRWTFEYTAPTAATVGDDWNVPVTITIYSKDDVSDKDTITLPFIVNTPPTITNIQFAEDSGASAQVVGLNDTVTLDVAVTDKNQTQGDTITYVFNVIQGDATLNPISTTLGWTDFTAPTTRQKVYVNVQVIDSKGGMDQETFTAYVQDPMSVAMGKDQTNTALAAVLVASGYAWNTADADATLYEEITDEETNKYKVGYRTVGSSYVKTPIANGADSIDNSADTTVAGTMLEAGLGDIAQYYFTGAPEGAERADATHSVKWEVLNEKDEVIKGGTNTVLAEAAGSIIDKLNGFAFAPDPLANNTLLRGGTKKLRATVTADMDKRIITDTVRVNTPPYIEYVNFTTEDETGILYDQTNGVQTVQVSAGQTLYMNIGVFDQDNNDFDPQTDEYDITKTSGFFVNQVGSDDGTAASNKPGVLVDAYVLDAEIANFSTYNGASDANMAATLIDVAGAAKSDYSTRFSSIEFEIPEDATVDVATGLGQTYHYMLVHVTDGTGLAVDAAASGANIDVYTVPFEFALDDSDNADQRTFKVGTVAGKTAYNRSLVFEVVNKSGVGLIGKLKDVDTGVYWADQDGDDLEFDLGATGDADGNLELDDIVDSANDDNNWLAIDILAADAANWEEGDKVYFDTYANTVVLRYQVVEGPKVTAINSPRYATIGDSDIDITIIGKVDESKTATINITVPDDSDGSVTQGTDSDGDNVLNEVWLYTPPTQMNALKQARLLVTITEVDEENPRQTVFEHTIKLNYPPNIISMSADGTSQGDGGVFWVLAGTRSVIGMTANISDLDDTDRFLLAWDLLDGNTWGLMYPDGTYDISGLGETSGSKGNGMVDIQVSVRDIDPDGVQKTGVDFKTGVLGINEAPRVRNMALADGATAGIDTAGTAAADMTTNSDNDADFDNTAEYPNAELEITFNTTTAAKEVEDVVDDELAGLNYEWYISSDAAGNTPLLNVGTFYTEPEVVNDVMASRLHWIPNENVRKLGGTYYVNAIVSDDKPGAAQGRTKVALPVTITADTTAPDPTGAEISATVIKDLGVANVLGIGDQVKFTVDLASGVTGDLDYIELDISGMVDTGAAAGTHQITLTNPNKALHGVDYDYSNDKVEYIYTIGKGPTLATPADLAAVPALPLTAYDFLGNNAAGTTDFPAMVEAIDNYIDGAFDAGGTSPTQNANANTTLADVAAVIDPGDVITLSITSTNDLTTVYDATDAVVTGLGFNDEQATAYAAGAFSWTLDMGAVAGAVYAAGDTDIVLTATITDDAGNVEIVEIDAGTLIATLGANIDLVRPEVYSAMMFSYSYGADGAVGGNDDQLIDSTGRVYTTLATDINAGVTIITDDDDNSTAEIVVITFSKAMETTTLSDESIIVKRNSDGKVFSEGSNTSTDATSAENYYYVGAWSDDPATNDRNTLFISLIDSGNNAVSVSKSGEAFEILFTDNSATTTTAREVAADTNHIEVDTGLADFRVGRNALTW